MNQQKYTDISCLYVEDEATSRKLLFSILSRIFGKIHVAENGQQGLDVFSAERPDLVISDVCMPIMDGLTMIEKILELAEETQIILTTAHSDTEYLLRAIELGVDHYVMKPIDVDRLRAVVEQSSELIRVRRELARERAAKDDLIRDLQRALSEVETLRGILPICSFCKRIRNDEGYYEILEAYFSRHADVDFSHTICPECFKEHYPERYRSILDKS